MYNIILSLLFIFQFNSPLLADNKLKISHEKHAFVTNVTFDSLKNKASQAANNVKNLLSGKSKKSDSEVEKHETSPDENTSRQLLPDSSKPALASIPEDELNRCLKLLKDPHGFETQRDNEITQFKVSASQTDDLVEIYFICKYHGLNKEEK